VSSATAEVDIEYRPALIDVEDLQHAVADSGYTLAPAMEVIVRSAESRGLTLPETTGFTAIAGYGVYGRVDGYE